MSIMEIDSIIYIIARNFSEDSCAYFIKTEPSKALRAKIQKLLFLYKKVEILNFINIKQQKLGKKLLFYTIYIDGKQYASAKISLRTNQVWFGDFGFFDEKETPSGWEELIELIDRLEDEFKITQLEAEYFRDLIRDLKARIITDFVKFLYLHSIPLFMRENYEFEYSLKILEQVVTDYEINTENLAISKKDLEKAIELIKKWWEKCRTRKRSRA